MTEAPGSRPLASRHLPQLDGLRGLAILLVIWFHTLLTSAEFSEPTLIDAMYHRLRGIGWIGVDLFFVLSGFLITGILIDSRGRPKYFSNFYIRRTLRIFPLYWAFLIVLLVVGLVAPAGGWRPFLDHFWWLVLYGGNILVTREGLGAAWPASHVWSLAIEEQFYLVWPLVVWLVSPRHLGKVCLTFVAGSFALRLGLWSSGLPALNTTYYALTPLRMDGLALGGFIAYSVRQPGGLAFLRRWSLPAAALALAALVAVFARERVFGWSSTSMRLYGYSATSLFFGAVLVRVLAPDSPLGAVFRLPALRYVGKYSYAMYLVHLPIIELLAWLAPGLGKSPGPGARLPVEVAYLLFIIGLSLGAALVTWNLLEKHFLVLKDRFAPTSTSPPVAP